MLKLLRLLVIIIALGLFVIMAQVSSNIGLYGNALVMFYGIIYVPVFTVLFFINKGVKIGKEKEEFRKAKMIVDYQNSLKG